MTRIFKETSYYYDLKEDVIEFIEETNLTSEIEKVVETSFDELTFDEVCRALVYLNQFSYLDIPPHIKIGL